MALDVGRDVWRSIAGCIENTVEGDLDRVRLSSTCRALRRWIGPPMLCLTRPTALHHWYETSLIGDGTQYSARMEAVLRERELDPVVLGATLRRTGAMLTGSIVLQAVLGAQWPSDIDVVGCLQRFAPTDAVGIHNIIDISLCCSSGNTWNTMDTQSIGLWLGSSYAASFAALQSAERLVLRINYRCEDSMPPDLLLGNWPTGERQNIWRVLRGFDLSCCRCLWDGTDIYVENQECLRRRATFNQAVLQDRNIAWISGYYSGRLVAPLPHIWRRRVGKYADRGFVISGTGVLARAYREEKCGSERVVTATDRGTLDYVRCAAGEETVFIGVLTPDGVKGEHVDLWHSELYLGLRTKYLKRGVVVVRGVGLTCCWCDDYDIPDYMEVKGRSHTVEYADQTFITLTVDRGCKTFHLCISPGSVHMNGATGIN